MFKFLHSAKSDSYVARAMTVLAGAALFAGTGLLAGCPSNSNTEQTSTPPPPVAQPAAFSGVINGGRQPVANATVIAYASATTPGALPARIGATTTNSSGQFSIPFFSPAPVTGQAVYVVAKGGNAGAGVNAALKLMTIAGIQGGTLAPMAETVNINELSTVASTAALQGYLQFVDCSKVGGTAGNNCIAVANRSGMLSMAVTARNLVNVINGQASAFLTAQQSSSPLHLTLEKMNTLANALAACVNTAGGAGTPSSLCQSLFQAAGVGNSANTLKAAFLAAASPVANARGAAFYNLALPNTIFTPTLSAAPADWTVGGQQFAYAVNSAYNNVSAWRLSPLTGVMAAVTSGGAGACGATSATNCFDVPSDLGQAKLVRVSPNGRFAFILLSYLTSGGGHTTSLAHFLIDPATGALLYGGAKKFLTFTGTANGLVLSPNGRFAYMLNGCATNCPDAGNSIWEGTIDPDSGTFTPIADTPVSTGGIGSAAIDMSPHGRFAFVVNTCGSTTCGNGNSTLSAFEVNADTGALSMIGAPAVLSAASNASVQGASGITMAPHGRFAYIINNAAATLTSYQYTFEETHASSQGVQPHQSGISIGKTGSVPTGSDPTSVTGTGTVTTCPGSAGLGSGAGLSPHLSRGYAGTQIYVTNGGDNTVTSVTASSEGTLGTPSTTPAGANPSGIAASPDGCTVYVTNGGGNDVGVYGTTPGNPTLTPVTVSSTFPAGATPQGGAVTASGRFFYAGNAGDLSLSGWQVDATTGMLVPVAGEACPTGGHHNCFSSTSTANPLVTQALAASPVGDYLFMANANSAPNGNIPAFAIDGGSGVLTAVPGSPFGTGIGSMEWLTISPNGQVLYSVSQNGNVSSFGIGANGSLTAALDSDITGETPQFVAGDPSGNFLYVGNAGGGISAYTTGQSGTGLGIMSPVTGGGAASCPYSDATNCFWVGRDTDGIASVNTSQAGTVLYAVSGFGNGEADSVISVWAVTGPGSDVAGALTPLSSLAGVGSCGSHIGDGNNCYPAGYFPEILVASPDGKYLYASNQDNDSDIGMVSAWKINDDGSLTPITGGDAGPCGVAAGPDPDNCFALGPTTNPDQLSVDPTGRYLYVVNSGDIGNSGSGSVTVFAIAPTDSATPGALEPLSTVAPPVSPPTGGTPTSIATSPPPAGGFHNFD